jgi:hypothetical protein
MSTRAIVAVACIAYGLPEGIADFARHGAAQLWTVASSRWRRWRRP